MVPIPRLFELMGRSDDVVMRVLFVGIVGTKGGQDPRKSECELLFALFAGVAANLGR